MQPFQAKRGRSLHWTLALAIAIAATFLQSATAQETSLPAEVIAYADTVFYNGKVLTVDNDFTIAQAVAVRDGKFLAVGTSDRIVAMAGPETRRIDLQGKTVIPGILDIHQHPIGTGLREYWGKKWLPGAPR